MSTKKIKCLVVEDEVDLCEMIGAYLECTYNVEPLYAYSGQEAIEKIKMTNDLDVVICDYNMPKGNGGEVYAYVRKVNPNVDYIYCSTDSLSSHPEIDPHAIKGIIEKPQVLSGIDNIFKNYERAGVVSSSVSQDSERYALIRVSLLEKTDVLPCDLYIQLGKTRFIKYMSKNDPFTKDDTVKIYGKSLKYLSIKMEDLAVFFSKVFREFFSQQAQEEAANISIDAEVAALIDIQETIHDLASSYGFSRELQEVTKSQVTASMRVLNKNPNLKGYLDTVMKEPEHYLACHSICLASVSCDIAERMGWGSEQTLYKLTLAALLHDCTLTNPEVAKCQSNLDLLRESKKFNDSEKASWRTHPSDAAHLVSRFTEIPPDVDAIILQHHERPDGSGFPNKLSSLAISPLAAVFVVANDIVDEMFRYKRDFSLQEYIESRRDYFGQGQFRKILDSLKSDSEAFAA